MKVQVTCRQAKLFGDITGGNALLARPDQQAENIEAVFLGEGPEGFDEIHFFLFGELLISVKGDRK